MKDRATPDEITHFTEGVDGSHSKLSEFFQEAPGKTGPHALTSKDDVSELNTAIQALPTKGMRFQAPQAGEIAKIFAAALGIEEAVLMKDLEKERQEIRKQREQIAIEREKL